MPNGYNITAVTQALTRLGWKQPTARGYDKVDCDNTQSPSGRYYNDDSFHTSLQVEHIYNCQGDADISDEDFNCYLSQLRRSVILSALHTVFDAPQYMESGLLFRKQEATQRNAIVNKGKFVGLRLQVSEDCTITLKNALLLLDGAKTFNLYLFHSLTTGTDTISNVVTDVPYIKKWSVTAKGNTQTIVPLNYDLHYSNDAVKGGVWFLGYFQDDLGSVKAWDINPIANNYSMVGGVSFESVAANGSFDKETYGRSACMYGLNAELTACSDITQAIINNAHLFDNLQGLMMAAKVIELIKNSTRGNANKRIMSLNVNSLMVDLKGLRTEQGQWIPGIEAAIAKEVRNIKRSFERECKHININTIA